MKSRKANKQWEVVLIAGILALLPHAVLAQEDNSAQGHGYFGGGVARMEYDERQNAFNFFNAKVGAAYLRAGWQLNDHASLEGRVGLGGDATGDVIIGNSTVEFDYELDYFLGAYARVGLWASDAFYPYLIAGITGFRHTIEAKNGGTAARLTTGGRDFSYGLGADIATSEQWRINLEYLRLYDDRDADDIADIQYSALAIGVVKTF